MMLLFVAAALFAADTPPWVEGLGMAGVLLLLWWRERAAMRRVLEEVKRTRIVLNRLACAVERFEGAEEEDDDDDQAGDDKPPAF